MGLVLSISEQNRHVKTAMVAVEAVWQDVTKRCATSKIRMPQYIKDTVLKFTKEHDS